MKNLLLILLCGLLSVSLFSCAGDGNVEEDTDGIIEEDRESGKVDDVPGDSGTLPDESDSDTGLARRFLDEMTR